MNEIFLTGATGTIGSAVLAKLVGQGHRVHILIRAKNKDHLQKRLQEVTDFYKLSPQEISRIVPHQGDMTEENLGMSPSEAQDLFSRVHQILHGAASVKLNMSREQALDDSMRTTKRLLDLAEPFLAKNLQRIDFISTVGVGGRTVLRVPETFIDQEREFHNTYEMAKSQTEKMIHSLIQKSWPLTLIRPSMVIGDSKEGRVFQFQVFYYLSEFLSGKKSLGFLPQLGSRTLDVIPVDYVADSLCQIISDPGTRASVFHLCGGGESLSVQEIVEEVRREMMNQGLDLPRLRYLNPQHIRQGISWMQRLAPKKWAKKLSLVPHLLDYLGSDQLFLNENSKKYLTNHGIPLPPLRQSLQKSLKYYFGRKS